MNKKLFSVILLITLFVFAPKTKAVDVGQTGYINSQGVLFYSEANFSGSKVLDTLDTGDQIKILDTNLIASNDSIKCTSGFYKVSFYWESYNKKTYEGYVCSDSIKFEIDTSKYSEEFVASNIPTIYWEKLTLLKDTHPNWKFTGYNTNLKWEDVISAESQVGISYIQTTNPLYLSLDPGAYDPNTKSYIQMEAGGWYAANKKTVAYYMDPRNFFNEINIFMFENLGYNSSYQTKEVIESILNGTDLLQYADYFVQAATYNGNNVSPVSLAARSRQEVVIADGKLSDSANGSKYKDTVLYNFYNIGAFSKCTIDGVEVTQPIVCGLRYASGYDGTDLEYDRPWTTPEKAILNGAKFIGDGYINAGQNTLYLQRFNVTSQNTYSHQYMTNIEAPYSESISSYNAYKNIDKIDSTIEFLIPVYNEMPAEISTLPISVDNEKIEEIEKNVTLNEVITKSGYVYNDQYVSGVNLGTTATHMITAIKTAGGSATITSDDKNISGQEKLGTGDILNITVGEETKAYRIIINADVNGDSEVDAVDYVKIYKYIMDEGSLNGSYAIAADVNKDGSVDAVDYVKLYKYIMDGGTL